MFGQTLAKLGLTLS